MDNNDASLKELLELLQKRPELVRELVFNPDIIQDVLATMDISAPTAEFLKYIAAPQDGYAIAPCFNNTNVLCAKGTLHLAACGGGTNHPRPPPT